MKIKRYTAASMREALAQVRAEQGADAVILSSRRGEDGVEVIAAVDYDEALFVAANRQRVAAASPAAPAPQAAPKQPPKLIPAHFQRLTMSPEPIDALRRERPPADSSYGEMQRELQNLRRMVETGFAGITWNDKRMREPLKARVLEDLSAMDIAPDVAMWYRPRRSRVHLGNVGLYDFKRHAFDFLLRDRLRKDWVVNF